MTIQSDLTQARAPISGIGGRLRPALRGRRALVLLGLAAVAAGVSWQWTWLTATGVAPILVSVAPCIVMCALGLCMAGKSGRSCHASEPQVKAGSTASASKAMGRPREVAAAES
ncbi:hypothetical protein ROTAS13_02777 [Roseomonas sp. TAS13]|jgi:hypothetical protein|uniref:DUF2933 domain-containing protein n=1 Tax=Muricoccus roseus TaxID=198092 RepID=A0A1M6RM41_9PROT|nr:MULTISPECIES: hypothetical protein [Roseomonas]USQ74520.1 hypothetical protein NF552_25470 [Roseomonas mucosa]GAV35105.1 hypothetical protein ROTAS13_02777 [Roseomonas sp. TAS13]SHK33499.1 hypothetical protein SAMN02745194_04723 [Roseomonas rosea]